MKQRFNIENEKIETGFSAPENYFNKLEVNIQNKISQKPQASWISRHKYVLSGITASVIGVSIWLFQPNTTTIITTQENPDYALYINENIEDFDDELIYESYAEASNTTSARAAEDEVYSSYLIEDDIDENTLIDEL